MNATAEREIEIQAMWDDIATLRASAARLYQKDPKGEQFNKVLDELVSLLYELEPAEQKISFYKDLTAQKVFDMIRNYEMEAGEMWTDQGGMPFVPIKNYFDWLSLKNDPIVNEWLEENITNWSPRYSWMNYKTPYEEYDWNDVMDIYPHEYEKTNSNEGYEKNIMLLAQFIVSCDDIVKEEFLDWMNAECNWEPNWDEDKRDAYNDKWYGKNGINTKKRLNA